MRCFYARILSPQEESSFTEVERKVLVTVVYMEISLIKLLFSEEYNQGDFSTHRVCDLFSGLQKSSFKKETGIYV